MSLSKYMGGRYLVINKALRDGEDKYAMEISLIDKQLDELGRPVPGGLVVYRKAGKVSTYHKGKEAVPGFYTQKAYLSCSARKDNYCYETNYKKSTGQMYFTITCMALGAGRDVSPVRANAQEAEVLFHRDARFRVISSQPDKYGNELWVMEEVASDAGYVWGSHASKVNA